MLSLQSKNGLCLSFISSCDFVSTSHTTMTYPANHRTPLGIASDGNETCGANQETPYCGVLILRNGPLLYVFQVF